MEKHTNLDNEIEYVYYTKPNADRTNNIILGIGIGVMFISCAVIWVLSEVMMAVS